MRGMSVQRANTAASDQDKPSGPRPFDLFADMLRERSVFLNGAIDEPMAATVCAQLLFLDAKATDRPIALYINSPGGMVTAGLAIYDAMQYVQSEISTVCMGTASSMAALLLAGGASGRRIAMPNASFVLHQPSGGYQGSAADIERHAEDILRVKARLARLYAKHCGRTLEEVERTLDRDYFMNAEEAQAWGLVDHVYERRAA
jgi:ATP-dependent Clp protease protease subunit